MQSWCLYTKKTQRLGCAFGITPPEIGKWTEHCEVVVYGSGDKYDEDGIKETIKTRFNKHPRKGYPIPTFEKTIEEIRSKLLHSLNTLNSILN